MYVVHPYEDMVSGHADQATNLQEKLNQWEKQGFVLLAVVPQFENETKTETFQTGVGEMESTPREGPLFILRRPS